MPELPEVECLTRAFKNEALGGDCLEATFFREDLRFPIDVKGVRKILKNQKIEDVFRRSKYMIIRTAKGFVFIHLGMTGNIFRSAKKRSEHKHTHFSLKIRTFSGENLYFHYVDPRRFGSVHGCKLSEFDDYSLIAHLGPEPLETQNLAGHFKGLACGKVKPVKSFLMDNAVVVGVGNIYASESLYLSGIDPRRPAGEVMTDEWKRLSANIKKVLKKAIKAGGTSFSDYQHTDGSSGYFQVQLNVYGRKGEACNGCGSVIQQIRQSGRASFFCKNCQK